MKLLLTIFNTLTFLAAAAAADKETNHHDDAGLRGAKFEVHLVSDTANATGPKDRVIEDGQVGSALREATNGSFIPAFECWSDSSICIDKGETFRLVNQFGGDSFLDVCGGSADSGWGVQTTSSLDRDHAHRTSTWEWEARANPKFIENAIFYGHLLLSHSYGALYNPRYGYLTVSGDKVITTATKYGDESLWMMKNIGNILSQYPSGTVVNGDLVHIYNKSNKKYLDVNGFSECHEGSYNVMTSSSRDRHNSSGTWKVQKI